MWRNIYEYIVVIICLVFLGFIMMAAVQGADIIIDHIYGPAPEQPKQCINPFEMFDWDCTLINAKHPVGKPDECVQLTKTGFGGQM